MLKHFLVGYDGSESSRRAFMLAVTLARCSGGRVRAVTVLQVSEGGAESCALLMTDTSNQRLEEMRRELAALAPEDVDRVEMEVIHGTPGDALLGQVQRHDIDHIVIGHTDRGALARWLLGSCSGDVLARARVPVTVVR
jgi:nucleotide-binding universal stress UspA family protein